MVYTDIRIWVLNERLSEAKFLRVFRVCYDFGLNAPLGKFLIIKISQEHNIAKTEL
jgi:hypothetical protein